ncbi:hypothetical protein T439DRAFT_383114 [Meredithblackwellia eburnea MCA 4105]
MIPTPSSFEFKFTDGKTTRLLTLATVSAPTWAALSTQIRERFSLKESDVSTTSSLSYQDSDGDTITLSSDAELTELWASLKATNFATVEDLKFTFHRALPSSSNSDDNPEKTQLLNAIQAQLLQDPSFGHELREAVFAARTQTGAGEARFHPYSFFGGRGGHHHHRGGRHGRFHHRRCHRDNKDEAAADERQVRESEIESESETMRSASSDDSSSSSSDSESDNNSNNEKQDDNKKRGKGRKFHGGRYGHHRHHSRGFTGMFSAPPSSLKPNLELIPVPPLPLTLKDDDNTHPRHFKHGKHGKHDFPSPPPGFFAAGSNHHRHAHGHHGRFPPPPPGIFGEGDNFFVSVPLGGLGAEDFGGERGHGFRCGGRRARHGHEGGGFGGEGRRGGRGGFGRGRGGFRGMF